MADKQTTGRWPSGSVEAAFAKALGLPPDTIECAEAGDQDAMRALYAASSDTGDHPPNMENNGYADRFNIEKWRSPDLKGADQSPARRCYRRDHRIAVPTSYNAPVPALVAVAN